MVERGEREKWVDKKRDISTKKESPPRQLSSKKKKKFDLDKSSTSFLSDSTVTIKSSFFDKSPVVHFLRGPIGRVHIEEVRSSSNALYFPITRLHRIRLSDY